MERLKQEKLGLNNRLQDALSKVASTQSTARGYIVNLPDILFDVSHNPQSIGKLISHLEGLGREAAGVIGFLADKPWRRMAAMLRGRIDPVVATTPLSDRLLPASRLETEMRGLGFGVSSADPVEEAVREGRRLSSDLLVVAGSFYVVGDAMLASWRNGWIEPPEGEERQVLDTPSDAHLQGMQ
jgi:folylpolyglutamate synthase/dihydropteroate synthase